jgi:CBS domain-containing protein
MRTVGQQLQFKDQEVWTIAPEASVYQALEIMAEKGIGALVVVKDERVVGIISERDYARKIDLKGLTSRTARVEQIMTEKVYTIGPEQTVQDCMGLMTARRIRHLPVIKDDRLVGVISIGDVVKEMIEDQGFMITQLQSYIDGTTRHRP